MTAREKLRALSEEQPDLIKKLDLQQAAMEVGTMELEIIELRSQLPHGMKHCKIESRSCKLGHAWLTATNWIEQSCPTCRREDLAERIEAAYDQIESLRADRVTRWVCKVCGGQHIVDDHRDTELRKARSQLAEKETHSEVLKDLIREGLAHQCISAVLYDKMEAAVGPNPDDDDI
jgi:hypothetical protein